MDAAPLGSASLDHSETTQHHFDVESGCVRPARPGLTPHQRWIHGPVAAEREAVIEPLHLSANDKLQKRAARMDNCCLCPLYVLRPGGRVATAPGLCRDRLCPTCQKMRARQLATRLESIICTFDAPRFVTLTLRSNEDDLSTCMTRLYESFRTLRRRPDWKARVKAGAAVCEVTRSADTGRWHVHLHVVIDGEYFPQALLSAMWLDVTGDSSIVDIRAVHRRTDAVKYLTSYIAKGNGIDRWPHAAVCEYALGMHGRRLLLTFGVAKAPKIEEGEHGEVSEKVEVLCSASRVLRARDAGCPYADLATQLLQRAGGWGAVALGHTDRRRRSLDRPLDASDHLILTVALRRINGDATAWLPLIEPGRKFNGTDFSGRPGKLTDALLWPDVYAADTRHV